MIEFVKTMLTVQLFWALGVTLIAAVLPATFLTPVAIYISSSSSNTLDTLGGQLESNVQNQLNLPLIDAASLVFYTGNLIVDLLLNFVTAVPEMFTLLLSGLFILVPIDAIMQTYIKLFLFTLVAMIYFFGLLTFLSNMRSGRGVN